MASRDTTGNTPLSNAIAICGDADVAELLIDKGADTRQKISFEFAEVDTDPQMIEDASLLHMAVLQYRVNNVDLLLRRKVDLNVVDKKGRTPLHYAAASGRDDLVSKLVAQGADRSIRDLDGKSAADLASNDTIRTLLSKQ